MTLGCLKTYPVIPGREHSERTRNDEVSKNENGRDIMPGHCYYGCRGDA